MILPRMWSLQSVSASPITLIPYHSIPTTILTPSRLFLLSTGLPTNLLASIYAQNRPKTAK